MPGGLTADFGAAMAGLDPFEPNPAVAVAVSGGADSMALALLARDWTRHHGGDLLALVVDHGLRAESAAEARLTLDRLGRAGIRACLLTISDLRRGSALAERARIRRYEVLAEACVTRGILHLLLGHHVNDQVETVAMRVLRGSLTHGLAGMSAVRETSGLRLLRPLLAVDPARLRHFLTAAGTAWIDDPSNRDLAALRVRLRQNLAEVDTGKTALAAAIASAGGLRCREELETARELSRRLTIRPEGFAILSPGRISPAALARAVQTIGGSPYPPSPGQIFDLAAQPRPATVAGVRLLPARRLGDGLLLVREEAAIGPDVPALPGAIWDNRFRIGAGNAAAQAVVGKLGPDAARFRAISDLPSCVLRSLPAVRVDKTLAAVPNLHYANCENNLRINLLFCPPQPTAGPDFAAAG